MNTKIDLVSHLLKRKKLPEKKNSRAFASTNIALCKYWGKRNEELNLPMTSSLSISMAEMGTLTKLAITSNKDVIHLNEKEIMKGSTFHTRITEFLDLFRDEEDRYFSIHTFNTIPTAAGLASSASGFASLTLALNSLYQWNLSKRDLSILARLGSGSACRSLFKGFVIWNKGSKDSGIDSYAEPLEKKWKELRIGVLEISTEEKSMSSRDAMRQTLLSSPLYEPWPKKVEADLITIKESIENQDFRKLGQAVESNSLAMHATMISAWPPVLYWQADTIDFLRKIWRLRENEVDVYITMDAGPNIKILFLKDQENLLRARLPSLKIIAPFENNKDIQSKLNSTIEIDQ